ncbi:MAG: Asp-tRNA(Asn)/Glu-tRNA(Gln) amidotransferase GatCAB subunit C [Coriobacteriaceae bacterium]|jgi:aspartyl-tRNA(Asn)/glutamyl-tRNA(Gln) amidotransferase subunit C|nr:Asp-tRNA(Asn)/Glu-tRNA(Gln) amidotransferase subunit GatC [Olsenella sp.]MCI1289748.1 Asp-tRNA(Asn)/Glu-tRNA(Gln) amidotransferase subunit GatC [Olsenella sp.]RRF89999.1 MAG: Asp-tRNA(Asn)/Glu-tRNA(Gln) amidotransferase GatCAB subunit C [Coriobacteriaceae bacterium]
MALSQDDVAQIADYARIALTPSELEQMTTYMNEAVDLLEPITHYDLDGVEPTFHPIGDLSNVMGEDVVDDSVRALPIDVALHNAGSTHDRYFRVPSILGDSEEDF